MSNTPDHITALRALADAQAKATPHWSNYYNRHEVYQAQGLYPNVDRRIASVAGFNKHYDADFAVAARNTDFTALKRAFEELQQSRREWEADAERNLPRLLEFIESCRPSNFVQWRGHELRHMLNIITAAKPTAAQQQDRP